MNSSQIDQLIQERRIIVTCGTGGVGKTTLSASLAIRAAVLGKRAVVITIDPAKRLATSLGFDKRVGDAPADITPHLQEALKNHSEAAPGSLGKLHAIMPDTQGSFEKLVAQLAPNSALAQSLMQNPIFEIFAREFSGANEYMALERLISLHNTGEYDTIILDTPPSRNTLAFLDAPQLLARLFEEKLIQWLVVPTNQLFSIGIKKALGILEKLTGSGFMTHLFAFCQSLFDVRIKFLARLKDVTTLLQSQDVGFILVTASVPEAIPELQHFVDSVKDHGFHFDGLLINRTLGGLADDQSEWRSAGKSSEQAKQLGRARQLLQALVEREKVSYDAFKPLLEGSRRLGGGSILYEKLPELARDIHSLEDLLYVAFALGRSSGESGP